MPFDLASTPQIFTNQVHPKVSKSTNEYDLFVIGGGPGGLGTSKWAAAALKMRVGMVEEHRVLGGTCVNVGCHPKKLFWFAADLREKLHHASAYGLPSVPSSPPFDWKAFKERRDAHLANVVEDVYGKGTWTIFPSRASVGTVWLGVSDDKIDRLTGRGTLISPNSALITFPDGTTRTVTADYFVIATGKYPIIPSDVEGATKYGISSDGFFDLEELPKRTAIVGAGYIAVEVSCSFLSIVG
jgi:glutathione reductase (NADPH)